MAAMARLDLADRNSAGLANVIHPDAFQKQSRLETVIASVFNGCSALYDGKHDEDALSRIALDLIHSRRGTYDFAVVSETKVAGLRSLALRPGYLSSLESLAVPRDQAMKFDSVSLESESRNASIMIKVLAAKVDAMLDEEFRGYDKEETHSGLAYSVGSANVPTGVFANAVAGALFSVPRELRTQFSIYLTEKGMNAAFKGLNEAISIRLDAEFLRIDDKEIMRAFEGSGMDRFGSFLGTGSMAIVHREQDQPQLPIAGSTRIIDHQAKYSGLVADAVQSLRRR